MTRINTLLKNKSLCTGALAPSSAQHNNKTHEKDTEKTACTQDYYAKIRAIKNKNIGQKTGSTEKRSIVLVPFYVCKPNARMNQIHNVFIAVFNSLFFLFFGLCILNIYSKCDDRFSIARIELILHLDMYVHQMLMEQQTFQHLSIDVRINDSLQINWFCFLSSNSIYSNYISIG